MDVVVSAGDRVWGVEASAAGRFGARMRKEGREGREVREVREVREGREGREGQTSCVVCGRVSHPRRPFHVSSVRVYTYQCKCGPGGAAPRPWSATAGPTPPAAPPFPALLAVYAPPRRCIPRRPGPRRPGPHRDLGRTILRPQLGHRAPAAARIRVGVVPLPVPVGALRIRVHVIMVPRGRVEVPLVLRGGGVVHHVRIKVRTVPLRAATDLPPRVRGSL